MFFRIFGVLAIVSTAALAVDKPATGVPVQMVVTVAHHRLGAPQAFTRDDLIITETFDPLPITNFIPLVGDHADLELFLLVDDCSSCEFGPKFDELRRFVSLQADTTAVGVAYIRNGALEVIENPTKDRARAIQALSAPSGTKPANPFGALAEMVNAWPHNSARHVVLMITNGIDPAAKDDLQDASADKAIETAERAGVIVYAIYHPSADYLNGDLYQIHTGQVHLSHVAYETGGEAYFLGPEPLRSLTPFLTDIADHLVNQYQVEFLAEAGEVSGLQPITAKSKIPDMDLMVPDKVWVATPTRKPAPRGRVQ